MLLDPDLSQRALDQVLIIKCLGKIKAFDLMGLHQTHTVKSYQNQFDEIASLITGIDEAYFLSCYVNGLHEVIRSAVIYWKPKNLLATKGLARMVEENLINRRKLALGKLQGPLVESLAYCRPLTIAEITYVDMISSLEDKKEEEEKENEKEEKEEEEEEKEEEEEEKQEEEEEEKEEVEEEQEEEEGLKANCSAILDEQKDAFQQQIQQEQQENKDEEQEQPALYFEDYKGPDGSPHEVLLPASHNNIRYDWTSSEEQRKHGRSPTI